jgi:vitamin K-dependent gamma-carboxylase
MRTVQIRLSWSVDGASLAVFRIGLGLVGALVVARLWWNDWLSSLYATPTHHLRYPGLGWIPEVPRQAVFVVATAALVGALLVAVGWHHRLGAALFATSFAWLEATEATTYLNHYWLVTYLFVLAAFLPLSAAFSLQARGHGGKVWVPLGALWLLRGQIVLVYFYAGIAKLRSDWLVQGMPLRLWLPARADLPVVGGILDEPPTALVLAWLGLAFDLSVGFALLHRKLRPWAFAGVVLFHLATWLLFPSIGIFPLAMIVVTSVFFDPDWPRKLRAARARLSASSPSPFRPRAVEWGKAATSLAAVWLLLQLFLPLRHFLMAGDAVMTGAGYRFAWNVLAVEKAGSVSFRVTDVAAGNTWIDDATDLYTPTQIRVAASEPDLILQMAHAVAAAWQTAGPVIEVRADAFVSINGRPEQRLLNPDIDLAALPIDTAPALFVATRQAHGPVPASRVRADPNRKSPVGTGLFSQGDDRLTP